MPPTSREACLEEALHARPGTPQLPPEESVSKPLSTPPFGRPRVPKTSTGSPDQEAGDGPVDVVRTARGG